MAVKLSISLPLVGLFLLPLFSGCAEPPAAGGNYESPEAVFNAAQAACTKQDYGAVIGTMTDEAVEQVAVATAFVGNQLQKLGAQNDIDGDAKKSAEAVAAVFEKHGISAEVFAAENEDDAADPGKITEKLLASIKDPAEFTADMMAAAAQGGSQVMPITADATLAEVKVSGDEATGNMVIAAKDGSQTKSPIEFRKTDGGWKIHR